jgi:hypothetical protein
MTKEEIAWFSALGVSTDVLDALDQSFTIQASVGQGGTNNTEDVQAVQETLNRVADAGLDVNGTSDDKTIGAIKAFQKTLGFKKPDGLIEPGKRTAAALAKATPGLKLDVEFPPKKPGPTLGVDTKLQFNLSPDERAACDKYLDDHLGAVLKPDGSASRADGYQPTLDGKPVLIADVVVALLPLTLAGRMSKKGSDPMFKDTLSQLEFMANEWFVRATLPLQIEARGKALGEATDWVNDYLNKGDLRPNLVGDLGTGKEIMVMFQNKTCPLTKVAAQTVAAGQKADFKTGTDARDAITTALVMKLAVEILNSAKPVVPGPGPARPTITKLQKVVFALQYAFVPTTVHLRVPDGKESEDQPAQQLSGQVIAQFHADGEAGLEIQGFGQFTWFADDAGGHLKTQSGFGGVQVAWVWTFLDGAVQLGPFYQVLVGASRAEKESSGKIEWMPTGQISAGGQVQFDPFFNNEKLKGHLLVGLQAAATGTMPKDAPATADQAAALTVTYQF